MVDTLTTAYYVSTPRWTCLVEVRAGTIVRTAPYLAKWAMGHVWAVFARQLAQTYPTTLRISKLGRAYGDVASTTDRSTLRSACCVGGCRVCAGAC